MSRHHPGRHQRPLTAGDQYTYLAPPADIDVDLTAQPHLGILVPYLTYTLTAHNTGPDTVTSATLTTTLPPGATATNLSPGCTATATTVTCAYARSPTAPPPARPSASRCTCCPWATSRPPPPAPPPHPPTPTPPTTPHGTNCTVISIVLATCS